MSCSEIVVIDAELACLIFSTCGKLNSGLLVVTDALFEEVGLALKRDHIHPLEWVLVVIMLGDSELEQQTVSNEPNILAHEA